MNEDKRLVELMAEMLIKQDEMVHELRNVKKEVSSAREELSEKISGVKSEIAKLNLQSAENSRAVIKLADHAEKTIEFESRISKLEKIVYK